MRRCLRKNKCPLEKRNQVLKIINLTSQSQVYTCNSYLVTGDFNHIEDVNTLIDTGRDPKVIQDILEASTGVGKKRIQQVILTHSHYDHAGLIKEIKEKFDPKFYAFSNSLEDIDVVLKGTERILIGDRLFEVIYSPGHSNDSICLYNRDEKVLFSGDTNLNINSNDGSYENNYIEVIKYLVSLDIETVYGGHGSPLITDCNKIIERTLKNILRSKNINK